MAKKERKDSASPEKKGGATPGEEAGTEEAQSEETGGRRFSPLTLVEVAVAAAAFVGLYFLVHWLTAVSIASALFVFLDAAMNHVYKVKPVSEESRAALVFWSVVGFVPFVGLIVYVAMRRKLASAPAVDVTTGKEAVETVKSRMRAVPVPAAIVVALIAIGLALLTWRPPERFKRIVFGTSYTRSLRVVGVGDTFPVGRIIVKLQSFKPMERFSHLDWKLFLVGRSGSPINTGTVRAQPKPNDTIWIWRVGVRTDGYYRLDVVDGNNEVVARGYFTIEPKKR